MKELRLSATQRITGVVWGLIVTGAAVTAMVALSGTPVNLTNVAIVALLVLGGWLLLSALLSVRPRKAHSLPDAVAPDGETVAEDPPRADASEVTEELKPAAASDD
jgi:ABC-type nickel/cobalt efflux system permease component RcnA